MVAAIDVPRLKSQYKVVLQSNQSIYGLLLTVSMVHKCNIARCLPYPHGISVYIQNNKYIYMFFVSIYIY